MSDKKYVIPEAMFEAADEAIGKARRQKANLPGWENGSLGLYANDIKEISIEAALCWMAENPIVPTMEQLEILRKVYACNTASGDYHSALNRVATEWQRIMFRAPKSLVPEGIKSLLLQGEFDPVPSRKVYNERILEAYREGAKSK